MSTATQVPEFKEAIHIAQGITLASMGWDLCGVWLQDSLELGRSALDPEEHSRCRRQHWIREFDHREKYRTQKGAQKRKRELEESLTSLVLSPEGLKRSFDGFSSEWPIVIWTSRSWPDSLLSWWLMHSLKQLQTPLDRIWLVNCETNEQLSIQGADRLSRFYQAAVPLTRQRLEEGSQLWEQFVSPDPTVFSKSLARTLPHAASQYFDCFPRASADSVYLSELDQFLFDGLAANSWRRPVDLIEKHMNAAVDSGLWTGTGESSIPSRLIQWDNPAWPVLESRPIEGVNAFTSVEYRLTELGIQLRDTGLSVVEKAPTIWTGGCQLYAGPRLWCVEGSEENSSQLATRPWP